MTNNDELAIKSEERIKAIANGAQMLMGESRQLAAAALYWKEQARIATDAFQQAGIMQVKAEDKIEVLLAERDADKKRIENLSTERAKGVETLQSELIQARIRIAELEARTVSLTIKSPTIGRAYSALAHVWTVQEVREACDDAGIKLEVGE